MHRTLFIDQVPDRWPSAGSGSAALPSRGVCPAKPGLARRRENGKVRRWPRRWLPGPKHGLARNCAVYGIPPPELAQLAERLAACDQLRAWAGTRGLDLDGGPEDLNLLDQELDEATGQARTEPGGPARIAALGGEAGLFLGRVIIATVPGAHWRLWPNGHPVMRLPSRPDLDVVALANHRVIHGTPGLAQVHADAVAERPRRSGTGPAGQRPFPCLQLVSLTRGH